ncbi:MAG: leucine-rich repeat protein [Ruminococcus sp.]|nr:leucine-rich repeat protein [Ruminococcus sp.]
MKGFKGKGRKIQAALLACMLSMPIAAPALQSITAFAEDSTVQSGTHENLTWRLEDGVLTISGEGDMTSESYSTNGAVYTAVVIEGGITSIPENAFRYNSKITSVEISAPIQTIPDSAFKSCTSLERVVLPDSVELIDMMAFWNCALTEIELPSSLKVIESYAFYGNQMTSIILPEGLETIGFQTFDMAANSDEDPLCFGDVVLPDSVTSICGTSFGDMKSITLGAGLAEISGTFQDLEQLDEIYVSDENPYFEAEDGILYNKGRTALIDAAPTHAFQSDTLTIPDTVQSIQKKIKLECFRAFEVSELNLYLSAVDGVLLNKDRTKVLMYPCGKSDPVFFVPDTVTTICERACSDSKITCVILPESVTTIETYAFYSSAVSTVYTTPGLTNIHQRAFSGLDMEFFEFMAENGTLEKDALDSSRMKTLYLPVGSMMDEEMIEDALYATTAVVYRDAVVGDQTEAAGSCGENLTWALSDGILTICGNGPMEGFSSEEAYPWYGRYYHTVRFSGENIEIGAYAFQNSPRLHSMDLSGVTAAGMRAFANCPYLCYFENDESLSFLGENALQDTHFLKCSEYYVRDGFSVLGHVIIRLEEDAEVVTIPEEISCVMNSAFSESTKLNTLYVPQTGVYYHSRAFLDNTTLEHVRMIGSETDLTLAVFQAAAESCKSVSLMDKAGNVCSGTAIHRENSLLLLANALQSTPFMNGLYDLYCQERIAATECSSEMSDEQLIRILFDSVMNESTYSFIYMEAPYGEYSGDGTEWTLADRLTHQAEGLMILQQGICSSYCMMFDSLITLLREEGISDTIQCLENRGANHEWNVIGLDVGTESERWYYLDGANRVYLFGYEHGILKSSPEMFAYTSDIPENEDGTYTITLYDGTQIRLQGDSLQSGAVCGDVDGNGLVEITDATLTLTIYARQAASLPLTATEAEIAAADVDGDGVVDISDATAILTYYARYAAGLKPSWEHILGV